jgi:hypothetical protein
VVGDGEIPRPPPGWDSEAMPMAPREPALPRQWRRVTAHVARPRHVVFLSVPSNRALVLAALGLVLLSGFLVARHRALHSLRVAETDTARNTLPATGRAPADSAWDDLPAPPGHPDGVTLELFGRIRARMTVEDVFVLLGPGKVVSPGGDGAGVSPVITYGWRGDAQCGRVVAVEFENGRAVAHGKSTD